MQVMPANSVVKKSFRFRKNSIKLELLIELHLDNIRFINLELIQTNYADKKFALKQMYHSLSIQK